MNNFVVVWEKLQWFEVLPVTRCKVIELVWNSVVLGFSRFSCCQMDVCVNGSWAKSKLSYSYHCSKTKHKQMILNLALLLEHC